MKPPFLIFPVIDYFVVYFLPQFHILQVVSKRDNIQTHGGMSEASAEGTQHSVRIEGKHLNHLDHCCPRCQVRMEEELAFSDWINTNLGQDPTLAHILPIQVSFSFAFLPGLEIKPLMQDHHLYEAVKDGILLCKVITDHLLVFILLL